MNKIRLSSIILVSLLLIGCGSAQTQKGTSSVVSIVNLDCQSCGGEIVDAISALDGVHKATFHKMSVEVQFRYDPARVDEKDIVDAIEKEGFSVEAGAGKGTYQAYPHYPEGSDVVIVERDGAKIDLEKHLAPGKYTIIDFYAAWCGPCRKLGESLVGIIRDNPHIALRKIDIVDWDRPVVKQHLSGVPQLPYVRIYGPDGAFIDDISGLDLPRLKRALVLEEAVD